MKFFKNVKEKITNKVMNRGEKEQYYVRCTQESIIDKETFEAVQTLLIHRDKYFHRVNQHTFTKMIVCSLCNHSFKRVVVNNISYWVCNHHNHNAKNCPMKPIPETAIQTAYIRMFNKLKRFGDKIISPAISQLEDLIMKKQCGNKQILSARGELIAIREKKNQITRLHSSGILSDDIYNAQKKEIEVRCTGNEKVPAQAQK